MIQSEGGYPAALQSLVGNRAEEVAALYPPEYFPPSEIGSSEELALARVMGDRDNVCPPYDNARRAAAGGSDVYLYNFARPDADPPFARLGAAHLAEIGYVFGSIELASEANRRVADSMQGYWMRFARDGDPNGDGAVEWPRYDEVADSASTSMSRSPYSRDSVVRSVSSGGISMTNNSSDADAEGGLSGSFADR